ncbi:MAG: hypothetical protein AB1543_01875 [Candidatus Bipolaricaulota bacterium]
MRAKAWIGTAFVIFATILVVALLWPVPDPFANVSTVAIRPPDWGQTDRSLQAPFMDELTITLGTKNVRIIADANAADAVLSVQDVRVDSIELRLDSGKLTGRMSATCVLTELRTGGTQLMDFRLELRDGTVRTTLTARRFWQFWKPR